MRTNNQNNVEHSTLPLLRAKRLLTGRETLISPIIWQYAAFPNIKEARLTSNESVHKNISHIRATWLARLAERRTAVREVEGLSPRPDQHWGSFKKDYKP